MASETLRLFSADSHVVEPAHCYVDHIEARFKARAPHFVTNEHGGEMVVFEDLPAIPAAAMAPIGHRLEGPLGFKDKTLAQVNRGAFDPQQRLLDQDRDGVVGEILYPTIGMYVCANDDPDYKQACFQAYNRWLRDEFVSHAPDRLIGLGMTAVRSVDEAIRDVRAMKDQGFRGVMLPSEPSTEVDYDDLSFDRLWSACTEMDLPISFHILSSRAIKKAVAAAMGTGGGGRGPAANRTQDVLREVQDIIGMFIWSGVFERHPKLKLICTEADAGWAPHYMQYADHYFLDRPDKKFGSGLSRKPSEYFLDNVYMTFQKDWVALRSLHMLNPARLLWANDFPHPDACWLESQALLAANAAHLSPADRDAIVHDNVLEVYGLQPRTPATPEGQAALAR
jgi:predicted TIM-barrel fold metal-dependent hydrolase